MFNIKQNNNLILISNFNKIKNILFENNFEI
jgi:hypothetical protein